MEEDNNIGLKLITKYDTRYLLADFDNKTFLSSMKNIIVKEVNIYTCMRLFIGYQFFYYCNDQVVTTGLITDISEKHHESLISLGCSEEELKNEEYGYYLKYINLNDNFCIVKDDFKLKDVNVLNIAKIIVRLDLNKNECLKNIIINSNICKIITSNAAIVYYFVKVENEFLVTIFKEQYFDSIEQKCGINSSYVNFKPKKNAIRCINKNVLVSSNLPDFIQEYIKVGNLLKNIPVEDEEEEGLMEGLF